MRKNLFPLCFFVLLLTSCNNEKASPVAAKDSTANTSTDDAGINQAVQNAYKAFYYKRNVDFDTAVAKKPFLPQAQFIHFEEGDSVAIEGLDAFMAGFRKLMKSNDIDSFIIKEVHGETKQFGNMAERFSSYKMYINTTDTVGERGINSFQLVHAKEGWRVSSMTRQAQDKDAMLTQEYLKEDHEQ